MADKPVNGAPAPSQSEYIFAVTANGELIFFVPIAAGILRDAARELIRVADMAVVMPSPVGGKEGGKQNEK